MISDDDMIDAVQEARGDNQMAFVKLERRFRNILNENLESLHDQQELQKFGTRTILNI